MLLCSQGMRQMTGETRLWCIRQHVGHMHAAACAAVPGGVDGVHDGDVGHRDSWDLQHLRQRWRAIVAPVAKQQVCIVRLQHNLLLIFPWLFWSTSQMHISLACPCHINICACSAVRSVEAHARQQSPL